MRMFSVDHLVVFTWMFFLIHFSAVVAIAENVTGFVSDPRPCVGYNPMIGDWKEVTPSSMSDKYWNCPVGYGMFSVGLGSGRERGGGKVYTAGDCCPLPDGVLTEEHSLHVQQCPEDSIVTGMKPSILISHEECTENVPRCTDRIEQSDKMYRCTKIDTKRFVLDKPMPALLGGLRKQFVTTFAKLTARSAIPLAIRYSVGRRSRFTWAPQACVGYPWGSLFVGREEKYCEDTYFRQLRSKDTGEPVQLFPKCRFLEGRYDKNPRCVD